jgi:hypothetical protein
MQVFEASARTGEGMEAWLQFLETRLMLMRQERAP